jgi:hypothetical protein
MSDRGEALRIEGLQAVLAGDHSRAVDRFLAALDAGVAGPDRVDVHAALCSTLIKVDRQSDALTHGEEALRLDKMGGHDRFEDIDLRRMMFGTLDLLWVDKADAIEEVHGVERSRSYLIERLKLVPVSGVHLPFVHYKICRSLIKSFELAGGDPSYEPSIHEYAGNVLKAEIPDTPGTTSYGAYEAMRRSAQEIFNRSSPQSISNKSRESSANSGCWIATASCGADSIEAEVLRNFRDRVLLRSQVGRLAHRTYYVTAPPIARLIASSSFLRKLVRVLVIRPAARFVTRRPARRLDS